MKTGVISQPPREVPGYEEAISVPDSNRVTAVDVNVETADIAAGLRAAQEAFGAFVLHPGQLTDEQRRKLREEWEAMYGGQHGAPLVFSAPITAAPWLATDIQPLTLSAADEAYLLKSANQPDVAQLLCIPPELVDGKPESWRDRPGML